MNTTKGLASLLVFSATLALSTFSANAQDLDKIENKFEYIQLPTKPLDKSLKNYQSKVVSNAEDLNKKLLADFELAKIKAEED